MPFAETNDGSGLINADYVLALVAYSSSSSNFTIAAKPLPGRHMHAGGTDADIAVGGTYTTKAAAQAAVDAFVASAGYPWVAVGSVPNPVSMGVYIVAVNLANVTNIGDDTGTGLVFNGSVTSGGYAPWADGPTAIGALTALTGTVELP